MRTSASGKTKMKEIYAPNKKVKAGVYVIAALLVLLYLLCDGFVAAVVSAGRMDSG